MPAALYCKAGNGGWQELKGVRQGAYRRLLPAQPGLPARTRVLMKEKR